MTAASTPDGLMTAGVEVYVVAFDEPHGLYCLNEDNGIPYLALPLDSLTDVHWEVQYLLRDHGIRENQEIALHSTSGEWPNAWPHMRPDYKPEFPTSWHPKHTSLIVTYMAVVAPLTPCVLDTWPHAKPLTVDLFLAKGNPEAHKPTAPPVPRDYDVLFHGLRHLHHLHSTNLENRQALGPAFGRHIEPFPPVLFKMYETVRQPA